MDFSIKFATVESGWTIVCIEGSQVIYKYIFFEKIYIVFLLGRWTFPYNLIQFDTVRTVHCIY